MGKSDRDHFKTYTPQNRIKHVILGKYFSAYLTALGPSAQAFHYIDGFAGGGLYEDRYEGSPLIALTLLGTQERPCSASFVEEDQKLFPKLREAVEHHAVISKLFDAPFLRQGRFQDYVGAIVSRPVYATYSRVATFAFVDPCGVKGVRMSDLAQVLSRKYGECLLFWNYDGINRWLGGVRAGTHDVEGLIELFGSELAVNEVLEYFDPDGASAEKEKSILSLYLDALRTYGKPYVLPFRVEAKDRDRTSHYLIHCSGHPLAFRIMKDVMGSASTSTSEAGTFEFLSAFETGSLFAPIEDEARNSILKELQAGPRRVGFFTKGWIERPGDYFREQDYRQILLSLEEAGHIEVLDKDGANPAPRNKRRKGQGGKPTLAEGYFLRKRT